MQEIQIDRGAENANQTFSTTLNGKIFFFKLQYRTLSKHWSMTISDDQNNLICAGVRLVKGCNLLKAYNISKDFGGFFVSGDAPTLENIGDSSKLIWVYDNA